MTMKRTQAWRGVAAALAGLLLVAMAEAAMVGAPESWSNAVAAGWACRDLVNEKPAAGFACVTGAVQVTFAKQTMSMPPEEYLLLADGSASGGAFVGDYLAAGVLEVSFRVFCQQPEQVRLLLAGAASGRVWQYVAPGVATGQWTTVRVPLDPGVLRNLNRQELPSGFEQDLRSVGWIGVAIQRADSLSAQSCLVSDFALNGQPQFGTWMEQFADPAGAGQGNHNRLPTGDLDGDGAGNYAEWLAGTSAADAGACLQIRAGGKEGGQGGFTLKWDSVEGRTYSVWRATDLRGEFTQVSPELDARPPENTFTDPATNGSGAVFYQIKARNPLAP